MPKYEYEEVKNIRFTDRKLFAGVDGYAKKKDISFSSAARELMRKGLTTIDPGQMNSNEVLLEILGLVRAIYDQVDINQIQMAAILQEVESQNTLLDEAKKFAPPLLNLVAEVSLVSRLEFMRRHPVEFKDAKALIENKVGAIHRDARQEKDV